MPNVKLIYGPEHRLLTNVANLEGLRRVAADKLACAPAKVILAFKEPESGDLWDIEDAGVFEELAANRQAFHARIKEGRPTTIVGAGPGPSTLGSAAAGHPRPVDAARVGQKGPDGGLERSTSGLRQARQSRSSSERRGRKRSNVAVSHSDDDRRSEIRRGRQSDSGIHQVDEEEEQVNRQLQIPAYAEPSSRARWNEADTNEFWRVFVSEVQLMPEPNPIYTREQAVSLFRTIVARHGSSGSVSKVVAGRTAGALDSRARVLVTDARDRGTPLSYRIFAVFPTSEEKRAARLQQARSVSATSSASASADRTGSARRSASRERPRRRDSIASSSSRHSQHRPQSDGRTSTNRSSAAASSSAHPHVQQRKRRRRDEQSDAQLLSADSDSDEDGVDEHDRRATLSKSAWNRSSRDRPPPVVSARSVRAPSNAHLINYNPFARFAVPSVARQLSNPPLDIGATSILQEDEPGTPPSAAATHAQASPSSSATNRARGVALDEVTTDAPRDASPLQERQGTVTVKLEEEEIDGEERDELMTDAGSSLEASLPVIPARSLRSARRTSERATTARAGAAGSISDLKQAEDRARKAIRRGLDDHLLDLKLTDRRITLPAVVWMDPFVDALQEWLPPRYNTRQSPPYVEDAQQNHFERFVSGGFDEIFGCAFRGLDPSMSIRRTSFAACRLLHEILGRIALVAQESGNVEMSDGVDILFKLVEAKVYGETDSSRPLPSRQPWPYIDVAAALCLTTAGLADKAGSSLLDRIMAARRLRAAITSSTSASHLGQQESGPFTFASLDKLQDFLSKLMASRQFLARCESMRSFIVEHRQRQTQSGASPPAVRIRKEVLDLIEEALEEETKRVQLGLEAQQDSGRQHDQGKRKEKLEAILKASYDWNSSGDLAI
ncbi:hypothetical protein FA10DRAFT_266926 [Acaromyces ingoldii]|uniref:Uncharacterized protein n=1 Tax=Acaromyces ingoldii TaxID=215250 RepID=A0A316YMG8_9BASI|nr:hypothetical protein FA10DRAFT_266926 [Acaromyces ingoldii]PWN90449.1 hypothetical protein FA10DRAFT_266926 [Acaromyces ingoldii]